jgi:hypothetical protein
MVNGRKNVKEQNQADGEKNVQMQTNQGKNPAD